MRNLRAAARDAVRDLVRITQTATTPLRATGARSRTAPESNEGREAVRVSCLSVQAEMARQRRRTRRDDSQYSRVSFRDAERLSHGRRDEGADGCARRLRRS